MSTVKGRGFTLIELLVVIAIIGILSAVVLASMSTARKKSYDTAIQSNMATIRVQAEVYASNASEAKPYGNDEFRNKVCLTANPGTLFVDPTIKSALTAISNIVGGATNMQCSGGGSPAIYMVEVPLSTSGYWCIDSTGFSGFRTTGLVGAGTRACPGT